MRRCCHSGDSHPDGYALALPPMFAQPASRAILLVLLSVAVFLSLASVLIVGPLLVALAQTYGTSLSVAGQLAAAPTITWAIAASLVGPFSDRYGQRRPLLLGLLLMLIGLLGAVWAWNFESMLFLRLFTGLGAGMVPANCYAMISETFPPPKRGKAIGWLFSASSTAAAFGIPAYAFLLGIGGWHLPFYTTGILAFTVFLLGMIWLPATRTEPMRDTTFIAHYRAAAANPTVWYLLGANALQRILFLGMAAYLTAFFFDAYDLEAKDATLVLAVAGSGGIIGGYIGGRIADNPHRLTFLALSCIGAGLLALFTFIKVDGVWFVAVSACGTAIFNTISLPVVPTLLMELGGNSPTTSAGLFAMTSQVGAFVGPSIGGLILAVAGFSGMGLFFFLVSVIAAGLVRFRVREPKTYISARASASETL
jgi:predicted MFS family arabinose efflux permease